MGQAGRAVRSCNRFKMGEVQWPLQIMSISIPLSKV